MSNRPRKPPELGGGLPPRPKRGRPRKAPKIEKPFRPEPWFSKSLPEPSVYPAWKPHKLPPKEDAYWTTALRLMRVAKSATIMSEAVAFRAKLEQHLTNRPEEYGDFPPLLLRPFPELAIHPTRRTKADLRNKNRIRPKKERTYVKDLPKNEESENYRLRAALLYHLWLAGQVNGWLSARQLMHYMDMENYNTFRGQLQFVFAYGYAHETRRVPAGLWSL